jgi:hypothetical protein
MPISWGAIGVRPGRIANRLISKHQTGTAEMETRMDNASGPPLPAAPVSFKLFNKNNWAGDERSRVAITYANGGVRHLAPEFKDDASALRYMVRFHSEIPHEQ